MKFIHLAINSDVKSVANFIIEAYDLPIPDLILSVHTGGVNIGGLTNNLSDISREIELRFQRGVAEAAKVSSKSATSSFLSIIIIDIEYCTINIVDAWITTNAINRDANKLVGQALSSDNYGLHVPCIGFGSWHYTTGECQIEMSALLRQIIVCPSLVETESSARCLFRTSVVEEA